MRLAGASMLMHTNGIVAPERFPGRRIIARLAARRNASAIALSSVSSPDHSDDFGLHRVGRSPARSRGNQRVQQLAEHC